MEENTTQGIPADRYRSICVVGVLIFLACWACGCSDGIKECSLADVDEFQSIGPANPTVDAESLVKAKVASGPYRVLPGEVLEFTMPAILQVVTSQRQGQGQAVAPCRARVSNAGTITMPAIGEIPVAGHSLAEIEEAIANAYYPAYAKKRPLVYAEVVKHRVYKVTIQGAIGTPGIYKLQADQMSLVHLIMQAGGIAGEGASLIRIDRSNSLTGFRSPAASAAVRTSPQTALVRSTVPNGPNTSSADYSLKASANPNSAYSDVNLSFRPEGQSKSIGRLVIRRKGVTLIDEKIDLGSEPQRYSVLARAVSRDTSVSLADLENKLASLHNTLNSQAVQAAGGIRLASLEGHQRSDSSDSRGVLLGDDPAISFDMANDNMFPESNEDDPNKVLLLPVKGLNIPFADIALYEGDNIIVEKYMPRRFAILGLVGGEGLMDYPPETRYSLIEAIALAGGLDRTSEPRYATIYRLKGDGTIASKSFKVADLNKDNPRLSAMNVMIQPGDIIDVDRTPLTRSTAFVKSMFRISFGLYVPLIK